VVESGKTPEDLFHSTSFLRPAGCIRQAILFFGILAKKGLEQLTGSLKRAVMGPGNFGRIYDGDTCLLRLLAAGQYTGFFHKKIKPRFTGALCQSYVFLEKTTIY